MSFGCRLLAVAALVGGLTPSGLAQCCLDGRSQRSPELTPATPVRFAMKRLSRQTEADLRQQVAGFAEVGVGAEGKVTRPVAGEKARTPDFVMNEKTLERRTDLAVLPLRMGKECDIGLERREAYRRLGRDLRAVVGGMKEAAGDDDSDPEIFATVLRTNFRREGKDFAKDFAQPEAVPVLMQMLTPEAAPARLALVEQLGRIKGKASTEALARIAVFDLAADVRAAALEILRSRAKADYQSIVRAGLRYPWAPAVEHAAEALAALGDTDALPLVKELLEQPAPDQPFMAADKKTMMVRDIVRINHLSNCLMCHSTQTKFVVEKVGVRGVVPVSGEPLPPSTQYYVSGDVIVFADETYLQQDFSVTLPVKESGPWPKQQRFDYVVRTRPATDADRTRKPDPAFKEALRFAIAELTPKTGALRH